MIMETKRVGLIFLSCLCVLMTGCKSSDYKKAVQLQENGSYTEAIAVFLGIVIFLLLLNQKTRRMTLKILLGIVLTLGAAAGIGAAEFFIFGGELFAVIFPFTLLDLLLIISTVMAFRYLSTILHLTKYGERTTGTVIKLIAGKGNSYEVRYQVDGQEYICIGNRLTDKGKCGEKMTVCYLKENPQKSCLEGEELKSAVILAVAMSLLLVGMLVTEFVTLSQI